MLDGRITPVDTSVPFYRDGPMKLLLGMDTIPLPIASEEQLKEAVVAQGQDEGGAGQRWQQPATLSTLL